MSTWEERMAARAEARQAAEPDYGEDIPRELHGELMLGEPDAAHHWCTSCGLPDWCGQQIPCPRCGSPWQWYGRIADRDGTETGPPDPGRCPECYQWRRYGAGQEHFGWAWWRTCGHGCEHGHHKNELWLASAS